MAQFVTVVSFNSYSPKIEDIRDAASLVSGLELQARYLQDDELLDIEEDTPKCYIEISHRLLKKSCFLVVSEKNIRIYLQDINYCYLEKVLLRSLINLGGIKSGGDHLFNNLNWNNMNTFSKLMLRLL